MPRILFPLLFVATALLGQNVSKLPDWAKAQALAVGNETAPGEPDAWVVFDRTEVAYGGNNAVWTHRYRLVKILSERGISEGTFALHGLGGKATVVKKLKGWNLRPDNEVEKLDQDGVVSIEDAGDEDFSRATLTAAVLPRVVKGSWVAFESLEVTEFPLGPISTKAVLDSHPVRTWELEAGKREGWFSNLSQVDIRMDLFHFGDLVPAPPFSGQSLKLSNLPSLPKDEGGHPPFMNMLPMVVVRFLDPKLASAPVWSSWDVPAKWFYAKYREKIRPEASASAKSGPDFAALQRAWEWMGKELTYKQVYLSPERGWIPEFAAEVARKRFGDCKDLSCYLLSEASAAGFQAYPALARIVEGRVEASEHPYNAFNHVISAIRLDHTLGLSAEVSTPQGRFLLVDPTDPLTPLGRLNTGHSRGRVMVCLPEGALWVDIPEEAILQESVEVALEGEASREGVLTAEVQIKEMGNSWGLRSSAWKSGKVGVRQHLLREVLSLPPTGTLEVVALSDPRDAKTPFEIKVQVTHPKGLQPSGSEWGLAPLGWAIIPSVIQKPGVARVYPVEREAYGKLMYRARIKSAFRLQPVLPEKSIKTPFRAAAWKASSTPQGEGSMLDLALEHQGFKVSYPYAQREMGVQEWKKDRAAARNLMIDALSFKPMP